MAEMTCEMEVNNSKGKKILGGCGCGCLVIILVVVAIAY
jgi:hypothetical protein